jgi:hypothetical protein
MARRAAVLKLAGGCLAALCVAGLVIAADGDAPVLLSVAPGVVDGRPVGRVQTRGLPGDKPLQSMQSGLVAAVQLDLAVVDDQDRILAGGSVTLRLAYDLWDQVYSVSTADAELRFATLAELEDHLQTPDPLALLPAADWDDAARVRLRAAMTVHAIAPDERERVEDAIAGEPRRTREGQDQQEASVSLGRLIRMFYRGGEGSAGGQEIVSDRFTRKELTDAAH